MALNNCSNSGQGKHENKLTTRFPVSFQVKFKTVSTSYTVQAVSNDSLPVPIKRNHNCSSNRHAWLPDASEKSKPTFPNRQTKFTLTLTMPTHIPLSTNNLNTKFHCAFSAMTVTISLSQHSSTYTARQIIMLQASISRSPVSANIRQAPLFLHTTEPQVFNYSRLITKNVATKPRSLTKQIRPSRFSCQRFSKMWQLNQGHRPSRFSCQRFSFQLPSPGMTPGSVAPRTVHSVRPGSTTT